MCGGLLCYIQLALCVCAFVVRFVLCSYVCVWCACVVVRRLCVRAVVLCVCMVFVCALMVLWCLCYCIKCARGSLVRVWLSDALGVFLTRVFVVTMCVWLASALVRVIRCVRLCCYCMCVYGCLCLWCYYVVCKVVLCGFVAL